MKKPIVIILTLASLLPSWAQGAMRDVRALGLEALRKGRIPSTKPDRDFTKIPPGAKYASDHLLVRFAPHADWSIPTRAQKNKILKSLGSSVQQEYDLVPGLAVVALPPGQNVNPEILGRFNRVPQILYAEPDYIHRVMMEPDDPRFLNQSQWALNYWRDLADIDAPEAWDHATGNAEIVVAVIDTGMDYNHPDLMGNRWINEAEHDGIPGEDDDEPNNGYVDDVYGYDFRTPDPDPMDEPNLCHGTHVAGILGAVGNNSIGIAGVNWHVRIMALKAFGPDGSSLVSDEIEAIQYGVMMGAHVLNASWGGDPPDPSLKDAIEVTAGQANVMVVAAAGNQPEIGTNNDTNPCYPASFNCANIISVLATEQTPTKCEWSNYGEQTVDLGAPGFSIDSCLIDNNYGFREGTSMAAPFVSGACALLWSINPSLTYQQVKDIILDNTSSITELSGKCVTGGILNLHDAVNDPRVTDDSHAHVWATTLRGGQVVDTAWVDMWGNLVLDGALTELSPCDINDFQGFKFLNDAGSSVVALLDADAGSMYLAGHLYELYGTLTPANAHLVVKASDGKVLAYLDNTGNLYLKGQVYESMW